MDDLVGRTAVVTGGGSGIGRAIVARARRRGDERRDRRHRGGRGASGGVDEAEAAGARAIAVHADVADFASMQALADAAYAEFGAVHVLCNNAGVLIFGDMQELKIEDWNWLLGVNVFGVLNGIYAFLPRMLEAGEPGHIVNTASIAALSGHGVYGVSKSAILNITETLREDLADTPIGVSCLCPGMLNTKIVAAQRNRPASMGPKAHEPFGCGAGVVRCRPVALRPPRARGDPRRRALRVRRHPEGQRGRPQGAARSRTRQALVDAIDAGVVDEEADRDRALERLSDGTRLRRRRRGRRRRRSWP